MAGWYVLVRKENSKSTEVHADEQHAAGRDKKGPALASRTTSLFFSTTQKAMFLSTRKSWRTWLRAIDFAQGAAVKSKYMDEGSRSGERFRHAK
jgi:hypothetical protein